jgi:hypothetical protein
MYRIILTFVVISFVSLHWSRVWESVDAETSLVWQKDDSEGIIWADKSRHKPEKHKKGKDKKRKDKGKDKKDKKGKKPKKLPPCAPVKNPGLDDPSLKDVYARLERWNRFLPEASRVEKFCAMAENAFRFFRGTNHLYWEDHAHDFRLWTYGGGKEFRTFLCGDIHPENIGSFHTLESTLAYNINDFGVYF